MVRRASIPPQEVLVGAFGFDPHEAVSHFLVHVPTGAQQPVEISEHLSWDPDRIATAAHYGEKADGQVRSRLDRAAHEREVVEIAAQCSEILFNPHSR